MSRCHGCGAAVAPTTGRGRRRKWCSDRCRKQTLYSVPCEDCGTPLSGSEGRGPNAPTRCTPCNVRRVQGEALWTRASIIEAIRSWAASHGSPPVAPDWNASLARDRGKPDRGSEYPAVATVQNVFGSWRAAIVAAGFDGFAPGCYGRAGEDPAVIAETVQLYRSGMSLAAVGAALGVTDSTVGYRLRKAGEPRRRPGPVVA